MARKKKDSTGSVRRPLVLDGEGKPWYRLAVAVGGPSKLAAKIGIHERTFFRWVAGEVRPGAPARRFVAELAREHGVPDPFKGDHGPSEVPDRSPK